LSANLLKDSLIYGLASSVQKLIPIFFIPIITSYLGKEELKIFDIAFTYAYLFSWIIILGQDSAAAVYYFDKKKEMKEKILSYAFFIQICSLIIAFIFLNLYSVQLAEILFYHDNAIGKFWMLALWIIPGHVCLSYALNILQWQMKALAYLFICFFNTFCSIALVLLFLALKKSDLTALFSIYIITTSLTAFIALWLVRKNLLINIFPLQLKFLYKLIIFGLPFAFFSFFHQLIPSVDRFFLLKSEYTTQLPEYILSVKLGSCISLFTNAFAMAFSPYAFQLWNEDRAEKKISELFKVIFVFFFLAVPLLLIFKNVLVNIFADNTYILTASLLPFFFLGWVFDMFTYFSMLGIYKSQSGLRAFWILLLATVITCMLNIILIPYWGIFGAAAAFLASKMFIFFINLLFSKKIFNLNIYPGIFFPLLIATAGLCFLSTILNTYLYALLVVCFIIVLVSLLIKKGDVGIVFNVLSNRS
jgi:O-antigen/teichoic acid export membrane protein